MAVLTATRGAARAAFGIHHGEDARPPRGSAALAAGGGKAREGLDQGLGGRFAFQKFAGAGPHRGHDGGRMVQFADGKNRNFAGVGLNQFDRADGSRGIVRVNIHDDYFCPDVLYLAQHRVRGAGWKAHVTEDIAAHSGPFQTMLEHRQPFPVFGQKSYRYTLHWHHSVS